MRTATGPAARPATKAAVRPRLEDGAAARPALDLRLAVPATALWAGEALAGRWVPAPAGLLAAAAVGGFAALLGAALWGREHRRVQARAVGASGPLSRGADPGARPSRAPLAVAALATLAAGVFVAGVDGQDRRAGPLPLLAARSATASVELVVTDDPRPTARSAAGQPGATRTILVPARIVRLTTGSAGHGATAALRTPSGAGPTTEAAAGAGPAAVGGGRAAGHPGAGGAGGGLTLRLDVPVLVLALVGSDDRWSGLLPSTRVTVVARLGPPEPGDQIGAVLLVRGPPRVIGGPAWYQRLAGRLRAGLRSAADVLPQPARGLLPGLVDGDVSGLDPALRDDFRAAGLTHLTAVSGGNVMITMGAVLAALRRTRIGLRSRALWCAAVVIGFVVVARPSASVLRAAAMGLLAVIATGTGRGASVLPALAASVTVLLLARPDLALAPGFALSVLATAGIVVVAPGWRDRLARRLPGRLGRLAEGVAVAAAAHLACTPVIAWIGGGVSLVAIPANVAAEGAVAPATVLGVVALAVGPVCGRIARWAAWLAGWPCRWLILVARTAAGLPGATIGWPGGPLGGLTAAVALPAGFGLLRRRWGRAACVALLAGVLVGRALIANAPAGTAREALTRPLFAQAFLWSGPPVARSPPVAPLARRRPGRALAAARGR